MWWLSGGYEIADSRPPIPGRHGRRRGLDRSGLGISHLCRRLPDLGCPHHDHLSALRPTHPAACHVGAGRPAFSSRRCRSGGRAPVNARSRRRCGRPGDHALRRLGAMALAPYGDRGSLGGGLDSHLHHPGEARGVASAIYVSMLWDLWHYPITDHPHSLRDFTKTVGELLLVHVFIGTFLSIHWRRSGNLFVTGSVHALIDGVRNALLA
jgi:hypothetical protein